MSAQVINPTPLGPYGAAEIKAVARKYRFGSLLAGSAFWVTAFLAALVASIVFVSPPNSVRLPSVRIRVLDPPPPIEAWRATQGNRSTRSAPPIERGQVIPVDPELIEPDKIVGEPPVEPGGRDDPQGEPRGIVIPPDGYDPPPPPDSVIYVEELPEPIRRVVPRYPDVAREAGVSGTVFVRILVGRDGRVRNAFVEPKRSVPMLDQAALEAAHQWTFRPAMVNQRPVMVWVAIPMRFVP